MDPVTLDTFRRNAYRILGLPAAATQEQIESAARMMRLLASEEVAPKPSDAPWLGPVNRSSRDVDYALMRLTDPEGRSAERVWWFCDKPPVMDELAPLSPTADAAARTRHRHDEAITKLCRMLIVGAGGESLERWRGLLADFRKISSSDSYLQWLLAVENAGDFEKLANAEEIASHQSLMTGQAATALIPMADDFLDDQNYRSAGLIIGMLNEASSGRSGPAQDAADRILNRMEDDYTGRCNECMAQVSKAWESKKVNILKPACVRATHEAQGTISDLCRELLKWSINDFDRSERLRGQAVKVYVHIADAYEACLDKYSARQTLMKSTLIAQGTPMEPRLQQRIASLTGATPVRPDSGGSGGGGGGYRNYFSGGSRWAVIAVVVVVVNALRICSSSSSILSSGSLGSNPPRLSEPPRSIYNDPLSNFNNSPDTREMLELYRWSRMKPPPPGTPTLDEIAQAVNRSRKAPTIHELWLRAFAAQNGGALPDSESPAPERQ